MDLETFKKLHEYIELGLNKSLISKRLGLSYGSITKYSAMTVEEFEKRPKKVRDQIEPYRDFILDIIKTFPQIQTGNIYFRLQEAFPGFKYNRTEFYRYIKRLRIETGYDVYKDKKRLMTMKESLPPGFEAQVDYGQYKMKDMYGLTRRVYFFVMVLTYSNLKFVYFSAEPFTTETAVKAHSYAFKFYGGMPQSILYDHDRTFVVNNDCGEILLVKEFEEYVQKVGFSVVLCKPRSPNTKGIVERSVGFIKESFLYGRTYTGIDSLNSHALEWLDISGNEVIHYTKGKTARELFMEERKFLRKVPFEIEKGATQRVSQNSIQFKSVLYEVPLGYEGKKIIVRKEEDKLVLTDSITSEVIYIHDVCDKKGMHVKIPQGKSDSVSVRQMENLFKDNEVGTAFLKRMKEYMPTYYIRGCFMLKRIVRDIPRNDVLEGMDYCLRKSKCRIGFLLPYLMYKCGYEKVAHLVESRARGRYKQRALKIMEDINGERT
jgi:transposase